MTCFVYGLAPDRSHALTAMGHLSDIGIPRETVSVLADHRASSEGFAMETKAHAAHGAFSGGNIGGGIGWLVGLSTFAIPGIGLFVAAGPIIGFLAGIAVGQALGNIGGAMIEEMGIDDASVARYDHALKSGKILISVRFQDVSSIEPIADAMRRAGLTDVESTPEA